MKYLIFTLQNILVNSHMFIVVNINYITKKQLFINELTNYKLSVCVCRTLINKLTMFFQGHFLYNKNYKFVSNKYCQQQHTYCFYVSIND